MIGIDMKPWEHFGIPASPISHTQPVTDEHGVTVETWTYSHGGLRYSARVFVLAPTEVDKYGPGRRVLADRRVWLDASYLGAPAQHLDEIVAETLAVIADEGEWIA